MSALDGANGFQIDGVAENDKSGRPVASAGDVNGDGFDDVIIAARYSNLNGTSSGMFYVVYGRASSFAASMNLSDLDGTSGFKLKGEVASGAAFNDHGYCSASAGDVNGDGFDDLIVGAHYAASNGRYSGAAYVIFGMGITLNKTLTGDDDANTLSGGAFNDTIFGLSGHDVLFGDAGNDSLDGGEGNDTLMGGEGDDIYVTDGVDTITEESGSGTDTVRSSGSYALGANLEKLTLTGTAAINGTGNELDNTLTGNSAANTIWGGVGNDRLDGGTGTCHIPEGGRAVS